MNARLVSTIALLTLAIARLAAQNAATSDDAAIVRPDPASNDFVPGAIEAVDTDVLPPSQQTVEVLAPEPPAATETPVAGTNEPEQAANEAVAAAETPPEEQAETSATGEPEAFAATPPLKTPDARKKGYAPIKEASPLASDEAEILLAQADDPYSGVTPPPEPQLNFELPDEDEVILEIPGESGEGSSVSREAETISIDFEDVEAARIIQSVADLYDLNVFIPESLTGSVSIRLRNVTWRQVFDVVLEPFNFTYVEDRNIIKIRSREDIALEPVDTRVFIVNFATAGELQNAVKPLIDTTAGGAIQVDVRSNALVVTERPSQMNSIQEIIERLDRPTDQVMIESKFVEVTNRDIRDVGVNWSSLRGYNVQVGPFQSTYEHSRNRDRVDDTRDQGDYSEGTNLSTDSDGNPSTSSFISDSTTLGSLTNLVYNSTVGRVDTAVFSADAFSVILSALSTVNEIELVSNPTVVTLNNTPAQINIGEEYPIPQYQYNDEQGTFEVSGFSYKPIGIILNVTPQVNSAGFINLDITPEISSRTGTVNFGGAAGAEIPIVTTRKTSSSVTIKSGYTLAIGGLIERTTGKTINKVPVLGDIPLLGRAFRHNSDSIDARNLIIFITAKVLNPDGSTYRDVFSQRTLYEMGIRERDLPGYEPEQDEARLFEEIQTARDDLDRLETESRLRGDLDNLYDRQEAEIRRQERSKEEPAKLRRRYGD